MSEWQKVQKQADAAQAAADDLNDQVEDLRCPEVFRHIRTLSWSDHRCNRDTDHSGDHYVSKFSD